MTGDMTTRGPEDDLARYRELERLVTAREGEEAGRWIVIAAFGMVAVAMSTLSWWWVSEAPTAVVAGTTAPALVWAGFVPAAVAMVVGLVRTDSRLGAVAVATVMLAGALTVSVGAVAGALHEIPGSAPWLALCGSLVTGTSAGAGLSHARARRPTATDEAG